MTTWMLCILLFAGLETHGPGEPLSVSGGFIFVDVSINGRGPFHMALDTGSTSCALTPEAASAAGLLPDERVILTTTAAERIVPAVTSAQVQLGHHVVQGVEILLDRSAAVRRIDAKADGVVGQSFLRRVAYLIDYRRKRLYLEDDADRQAVRLAGGAVSAGTSQNRPVIPVILHPGTRPWRMVLDTGSNRLVVGCGSRCPGNPDFEAPARLHSNVGELPARRAVIPRIQVAGLSFHDAEALLTETPRFDELGEGLLPACWFSVVYISRGGASVRLER